MSQVPTAAKLFIILTVLAAVAMLAYGFLHWQPVAPLRLAVWLAAAAAASRLKAKLPGVNGTMSVNLPFLLIVAAQLTLPEALVVAGFSSLAQSIGRNKPVQVVFNSGLLINAVGLAALALTAVLERHGAIAVAIILAALGYFLANTAPVAAILWLAEKEKPLLTWGRIAELTLPYYLLSAAVAAIVCCGMKNTAWTLPLLLLAVMYLTYRSYRVYFARSAAPKPVSSSAS